MEIMLESILWCIEGVLELYFILAVVNVALYWCMHFNIIGQGGPAFKNSLRFCIRLPNPYMPNCVNASNPYRDLTSRHTF